MKNKLFLTTALLLATYFSNAQNLSYWKHYYSKADIYYSYDMGNYLAAAGPEEIVEIDKSSLGISRIPYPAEIRNMNYHNNQYYDSSSMQMQSCLPQMLEGPGQTLFLRGCYNVNSYLYDGYGWSVFNTYQGFDTKTINFLVPSGGSTFFRTTNERLYKYDGSTLTYYDTTNSPYSSNSNILIAPNDDIMLSDYYNVNIYHNGTWTNYDTTFFNVSFLYTYYSCTSPSNDFTFFNYVDTLLHTFKNSTTTWSSMSIPNTMFHQSGSGQNLSSIKYDADANLWILGTGIFCMYDGNIFHDYFLSLPSSSTYYFITCVLGSGRVLLAGGNSQFEIFDAFNLSLTPFPADPQAVLTGNYLLPSLKDNTGSLWFGAAGWAQYNGVMKYKNGVWSALDLNAFGIDQAILSFAQDTGNSIVFGYGDLSSSGPVIICDTNLSFINPSPSLINNVMDIAIDDNHHYWYGGGGAGGCDGLVEFDGMGYIQYNNPFTFDEIRSVEIDSLNFKWVSYTGGGAYKFDGTNWVNYNTTNSQLPNDTVLQIIRQANTNTLWFATSGGFAKLNNGNWTVYDISNSPLSGNDAEYITFGSDSTIWFATQEGFASLHDTVWNVYTTFNSPLDNSDIESMVIDDDCTIWLATEFGLTSVQQYCGNGRFFSGMVYQPNGAIAPNTLVYVYQLNNSGTDVNQVDNVYTDIAGKYTYFTKDTGSFYFMAMPNAQMFPNQLPAYNDSSIVVQQAVPLSNNASGIYTKNIHLVQSVPSIGNCTFKGKLISSTERIGSVRLVLMHNGNPVASTISKYDGTFSFDSLAATNYNLWVDKFGLSNTYSPSINLNCVSGNIQSNFVLYSSHLTAVTNIANDKNLQCIIYPNPFNSSVNISLDAIADGKAILSIYNLDNKEVGNTTFKTSEGKNNFTVDMSMYAQGIYFYRMTSGENFFMGKLIKISGN